MNSRNSYLIQRTARGLQQGLTLIELMIATALSGFLFAGILQYFSAAERGYELIDNMAVLQENGRYALTTTSYSIRLADHWGGVQSSNLETVSGLTITGMGSCDTSWVSNFGVAIQGFEGGATIGDVVNLPSGCIAAGDYLANSDLIVVRYASPDNRVATADLGSTASPNNSDSLFIRATVGYRGQLLKGSDGIPAWLPNSEGTVNYPYKTELYFLRPCSVKDGTNCTDGIPTLVRLTLNTDTFQQESLIENIEQMQLIYGSDSDNDGVVDRYDNAAAVTNWGEVKAVEISILARGTDKDSSYTDSKIYNMVGTNYDVPTADENYYRKKFNKLIQIRNRNDF